MEKYYNNTENAQPNKTIIYFINKINSIPGNAIELGCGAGRDTKYLIKKGWNVLAIDKNDVEERISKRLSQEELKRFRFSQQSFEDVVLEKCELIVSNFSLSFCDKDKFNELWDKIQNSIISNGYFVGNFFGVNDEWNNAGTRRTFFTKKQVEELFDNFEIIFFEEFDKDGTTR